LSLLVQRKDEVEPMPYYADEHRNETRKYKERYKEGEGKIIALERRKEKVRT
jgi:hypothetical protein